MEANEPPWEELLREIQPSEPFALLLPPVPSYLYLPWMIAFVLICTHKVL